ncbi:MAG TPA: aminodeoxychorismate/anthranilate synthase component I [Cyanobacteria bacterium UBA8530]|nr:aminodeoxychorismate/anthranilate synthase component I [Cyanobacteria bacterium UBA8530]
MFSFLRPLLSRRELLSSEAGDDEFLSLAKEMSAGSERVLLVSGGEESSGRYSLAAWDPYIIFRSKGNKLEVRLPDRTEIFEGEPLEVLDEILEASRPDFELEGPFSGGAIGYFAYELKNRLERLPQKALDDLDLPEIYGIFPRSILIHDRQKKEIRITELSTEKKEFPKQFSDSLNTNLHSRAGGNKKEIGQSSNAPETPKEFHKPFIGTLESSFSHEDYCEAVRKILAALQAGEAYQVNLSQRFRFPFRGDPLAFWEQLLRRNPAPHFAYLDAGDHQVLSTSMERFLLRQGPLVETRPIKGTRKRGKNRKEDEFFKADLMNSAKDDAELTMIVDLLRNDLGRLCLTGSVKVREHRKLEAYHNVFHLVSTVEGELPAGTSHGSLLRSTFPGGSITGCPKIRAMEIIDELEPCVRHVYTGAIGYLGWHENLDLSVAIRTALIHRETGYLSVGGGIVADSKEEDEYQETLDKGQTFFQLLENEKNER